MPLPQRNSYRARFHDYSGGKYFITICTKDKIHYFGKIFDGEMHFSEIGQFAVNFLDNLSKHYSYADVPQFVVMPNHIHAVIFIETKPGEEIIMPQTRSALSVVVGGFKQAVTCFARRNNYEFGWQERYHDHIIRGLKDGNQISDYIEKNVILWDLDCFNK